MNILGRPEYEVATAKAKHLNATHAARDSATHVEGAKRDSLLACTCVTVPTGKAAAGIESLLAVGATTSTTDLMAPTPLSV